MKIKLEVIDIISAFENMNADEKCLFANAIKNDENIIKAVNEHLYDVCNSRGKIIQKREAVINEYQDKFGSIN